MIIRWLTVEERLSVETCAQRAGESIERMNKILDELVHEQVLMRDEGFLRIKDYD